ncbi:DNA (cytosine-5-)-methyltransferase, partial [Streptococcus pneumoniae]
IARFASILRPKYLFLENVKGLLNHENGVTFETIISTLDELGYNVEWQVLNSKNFGVPQNRERVFIIGHLRREHTRRIFPLSGKNQSTSNQSVMKIGNINPSGNGMNGEVYQADGLAPTLTTNKGEGQKIAIKSNTIKQFGVLQPNFNQCGVVYETDGIAPTIRAYQGGGLEPKIIQRGHGYNKGGEHNIAPTLTSNSYHENNHLSDGFRIRKLTPRECWRLQGFPDWAFDKAQEVNSNSQLYKQAGNSVTVNVIAAIAKELS